MVKLSMEITIFEVKIEPHKLQLLEMKLQQKINLDVECFKLKLQRLGVKLENWNCSVSSWSWKTGITASEACDL